ncbi:MAG TPA: WYL domain-containing protein [Acidimicrobiales bacterium]
MARPGADDRLRRILAVIPWVVAEDGPTLADVCAHFGYRDEKDLQEDLDLLFLCGVPPYTPDSLIEVDVADGRVWIRYADWFDRPLRLTAAEGLTLVAASSALLGVGPTDIESPLSRGLAKLAGALGMPGEAVDVALGPAPDELGVLQEAARRHRQVEIDYYAYGRDEHTTRVIDPHLVYSAEGQWYVTAFCHTAMADRLFRVDRVRRATMLERGFPTPPADEAPPVFAPSAADPVVVLDLEPAAAWAATRYPTEEVIDLGEGRRRVRFRVSGEAWLARLLLRLGPDATLVEGDGEVVKRAADRILARYRSRNGGVRRSR